MNPGLPKRPLKALILEDCDEDLFFLLRQLDGSGYKTDYHRVWAEADTREALLGKAWDVIISDSSMPGFDGLQALGLVREMGLNTPFILLSGMISPARAAAAKQAGVFECLPKNDLTLLPSIIERALRNATDRGSLQARKGFPPIGEPVIVQCRDFRCMGFLDAGRRWREYKNSQELPEVLDWFKI
jgi:CheY-like chemotaxis protein